MQPFGDFDAKIWGNSNLKNVFGAPAKMPCSEREFGGSVI